MKSLPNLCCLWLVGVGLAARAAGDNPRRPGGSRQPVQTSKASEVPTHPVDLILGRPTADSVTVSVLCHEDTEARLAYGTRRGTLTAQTPTRLFKRGEPREIPLTGLQPNTLYFYQLRSTRTNSAECVFHTARPPGTPFTFTVTADSHLDGQTDPALHQRTLALALADAPDFHLDLGDTFMTEKHANREDAARQYLAQRYYLGRLCASVPLFLVLGNHDGEGLRGPGADAESLAIWSNAMRKRYFPNPVPDTFYAGNPTRHPQAGLLQDYYAWEWGDALFVVLDPFWFTSRPRGRTDSWSVTLGSEQYQWVKGMLESSRAAFKFIFIHHLVGGVDNQCRGGVEVASLYEWGGKNADGSDGFAQHRPGWSAPIHQLLVRNHVSIVFHGHDHCYAKQDLDGLVYQEVPQPGHPGDGKLPRVAAEGGYVSGTLLGGSGHLRVTVSPQQTQVEYLRTDSARASVAHSYRVVPR